MPHLEGHAAITDCLFARLSFLRPQAAVESVPRLPAQRRLYGWQSILRQMKPKSNALVRRLSVGSMRACTLPMD
jgi:hypothetical protein